ncbi:MAG: hypothetical protein HQL32_04140 [Planctomycetes bacterium]|nr:hypothetical protein [Planctomycetota bacterium]
MKINGGRVSLGIDEAGYGPILGPLCISCFASNQDYQGPIADSKMLHKRKTLDPLIQKCQEYMPSFDPELPNKNDVQNQELSEQTNNEPWLGAFADLSYQQNSPADPAHFLSIEVMGVENFNQKVESGLNKAEVLIGLMQKTFEPVINQCLKADKIELTIDRLGGRKSYGEVLAKWGFLIRDGIETQKKSSYEGSYKGCPCEVSFNVKGDQNYHHIAAASCFSKLSRELAMAQFNHWWTTRIPNLKPTAGYFTDGKKFLKNIEFFCAENKIPLTTLLRII